MKREMPRTLLRSGLYLTGLSALFFTALNLTTTGNKPSRPAKRTWGSE